MSRIAYFITPHGFGHAARAAAIMAALRALVPSIRFDIFTQVPEWFFQDSVGDGFDYHPLCTDIGLVQHSALHADIDATLQRLDTFLPFPPATIAPLAQKLRTLGCGLVMCDIAPMGIAVAQAANVAAVLVENFTWDWIYEAYVAEHTAMRTAISYLHGLFTQADYHIQTEPICVTQAAAHLTTGPFTVNPKRDL